ncbi:hypothetical protein JD276_05240 [Leucobacter sp. CSA1]|uniref:ABC3 transporter permease C-terminal domain-containing protein n=1 Tax=Leucobacter chromiisoli TaxID=2796471 RepID=A0A934Q7U2_9MICO|nr:FtsX-like permease family protein [Leucobacter chromiisoli]MBK0418437.1 hypothetical protein [Leucobacter chromiisoli]
MVAFQASGTPSSERVLEGIPEGAQAEITAAAMPREAPPLPQLPEGVPWPLMDDSETLPAGPDEIAGVLAPGTELFEHWRSPQLFVSTELGLEPGEQRAAAEQESQLAGADLSRLSTAQLTEAEPEALPLLAPAVAEGRLPESPDELLLSRALADRVGAGIGDPVGLLAPPDHGMRSSEGNTMAAMQDSQRGYEVVGVADAPGETAWASAGWLQGLVAEHPEGIKRHWLAVGESPVTWEQAKQLNTLQAFAVSQHVLTHYPSSDELYPTPFDPLAHIEAVLGLVAASAIGALLVLFLVTPAFTVAAEQQRRSLGLAAAAGAAPRDLHRTILAQGVVLGATGGVVGALLGVGASIGFVAWLESLVRGSGASDPEYTVAGMLAHYPWWMLPLGALIALGLGALAALPPAVRAGRLAPVDALRDRRPAPKALGRGRRLFAALGGPALLLTAVAIAFAAFRLPLGELPDDPMAGGGPYAEPSGAGALGALVLLATALAAAGIVCCVRVLVAWLGRRGRRARPALRLALRDAADHPSRTVPATLGVLFAVATASSLLVMTASGAADFRDRGAGGIAWDGTFTAESTVPVSDAFDRALAEATIAGAAERFPRIEGSLPITGVAADAGVELQPLQPEHRACAEGEFPDTASALHPEKDPGAPPALRCVSDRSGAVFNAGYRFGAFANVWNMRLLDGDALRAMRLPGVAAEDAERAAAVIDAGGIVVSDATLIDDDGTVRVAVAPTGGAPAVPPSGEGAQRVERLPAAFLTGMGMPHVMSEETARGLGVDDFAFVAGIAVTSEPLSAAELREIRGDERFESLVFVATPDARSPFAVDGEPASLFMALAPILFLGLVAVCAAIVSVLLSATQVRRDAATMHAVGSGRGFLLGFGLARAWVILAIGVPAGIAAGLGFSAYRVAWNRHLEVSGAWLQTIPVWEWQLGIAVSVAATALAAAAIIARPRGLVRRALD